MFEIKKQIVDWNGEWYIIKRMIKETTIKEEFVQEYKEFINADVVLRKNGYYFFVEKIEEVQIELDEPVNP